MLYVLHKYILYLSIIVKSVFTVFKLTISVHNKTKYPTKYHISSPDIAKWLQSLENIYFSQYLWLIRDYVKERA